MFQLPSYGFVVQRASSPLQPCAEAQGWGADPFRVGKPATCVAGWGYAEAGKWGATAGTRGSSFVRRSLSGFLKVGMLFLFATACSKPNPSPSPSPTENVQMGTSSNVPSSARLVRSVGLVTAANSYDEV